MKSSTVNQFMAIRKGDPQQYVVVSNMAIRKLQKVLALYINQQRAVSVQIETRQCQCRARTRTNLLSNTKATPGSRPVSSREETKTIVNLSQTIKTIEPMSIVFLYFCKVARHRIALAS